MNRSSLNVLDNAEGVKTPAPAPAAVAMNSSVRGGFTEAVPLSLSSLAHLTVPLEDGVLDGIRELVQHTQLAAINYARKTKVHAHSLKELWADDWVWLKEASSKVPPQLAKIGFKHSYRQQVNLCLGEPDTVPGIGPTAGTSTGSGQNSSHTLNITNSSVNDDEWWKDPLVLANISFHYASEELFTHEELYALPGDDEYENEGQKNANGMLTDSDDDDLPIAVLYNVKFAYRSLPPPTEKSIISVEAEELSFLTFGGSVDDALKYGALASLSDVHAKYVLDVCSVRTSKRYRLDVMDATLSDGRLPRWKLDHETPFSKTLCVTVTDYHPTRTADTPTLTDLSLTMDGVLRKPKDCHPKLHYYTRALEKSFLLWHQKPVSIMAHPSGQSLLLNPDLAGQIYIDGRYHTTLGRNSSNLAVGVGALFGLDVSQIPVWHGRIVDHDLLFQVYATAWQEIMIDARLMGLGLNKMLLYRLMYGKDEMEVYDDDEDALDVSGNTLESTVMSSTKYDPVGICAKALATTFRMEFGPLAYPCLNGSVRAVQQQLGHLIPTVVPARLLSVLNRGGYFDMAQTMTEMWCAPTTVRSPTDEEQFLIEAACQLLNGTSSTATDSQDEMEEHDDNSTDTTSIVPSQILMTQLSLFPNDPNPLKHGNVVRYHSFKYYINQDVWSTFSENPFWLALELAKQHPEDAALLERQLYKNQVNGTLME